jgi:5-methylthioadenosine/S-adenosylhomocysteine deaminase
LDPTVLDAATVLRMTTIEAARALGIDHLTGSLEPGRAADIIIIDTASPHLTPMYRPESHLVYAARGSDVATTIISGRIVMQDRKFLSLDMEEIRNKIEIIAEEIRNNNHL